MEIEQVNKSTGSADITIRALLIQYLFNRADILYNEMQCKMN